MTPADRLEASAEARDEAAIRGLLAGMSEADRASLVPIARQIVATEKRKGLDGALPSMLLIAYGIMPVTEIRKLGWRTRHVPKQLDVVLRGRATDRLIPIVEHLLDDVGGSAWPTVRALVRDGTVPRPDRPSYTIAMLAGTRYRDQAEVVAEDPGLLDVEIWRLFEVEGGGEDSLASYEKYTGDRWGDLFRDLASRDPAMRRRLLDSSLAALARDFAAFRAGWFSRFHESLAPTDDERAERADAYLGLLRSRVGPTVSFAISALDRIGRAGRLSAVDLLARIGPVLADAPAGAAKTGLQLVGRAGAGSPEAGRRAAAVAIEALANPSPDVQRTAIDLIGRLVGDGDAGLARSLADRLPDVAASQRGAGAELAARLGADGPVAPPPSAAIAGTAPALRRSTSPIDPTRSLEAIGSLETLVDVAVSVLETGEPADDLERVLDAVGRLAAERPAGFARLTAPIARRARTILARRDSDPFIGLDPRADIAAVLLAWTAGDIVVPAAMHPSVEPGAGAFQSARAAEVARTVADGRSFLSVAAPTHSGGWIDPTVLVRRLAAHGPASRLDLVAALLRLAPDERLAARRAATGLPGEVGAVVRYALGGDETIGPSAAWWVAAARVRAPGEDDPALERRHRGLGPDAGRAARMRLRREAEVHGFATLRLDVEPAPPPDANVALPTTLMLRDPSSFFGSGLSEPAMYRWIGTVQPGYREPWSAIGCLLVGRNIDWWSAEWGNRAFLEPFLDPATAIGPHARTLLGIALGAKEPGERGLATDVVRQALADGRLMASGLAEGLGSTVTVACDRPNRWALALAAVAEESEDHAVSVATAVARSLAALADRPPAKLVPLLRLLDELSADTGCRPPDETRASLERLAGMQGQSGRLARSILSRGA